MTRRGWMASTAALTALRASASAGAPLIDTHVHLFLRGFPYHANAGYRPPAQTLGSYLAFAEAAHLDHVVVVHPEPYQDDHRYLEYCFAHEPSPGFFKGTCLFDGAYVTPNQFSFLGHTSEQRPAQPNTRARDDESGGLASTQILPH